MSTFTTNYDLVKPGVNDPTDQDQWGYQLNDDLDSIDSLLKQGIDFVTSAKTTSYTVVEADRKTLIKCDVSGGALTITLLPAATAGNGFTIAVKKTDSSGTAVTIDGNGAETIDGSANYSVSSQNDSVILVCDGTNWFSAAAKVGSAGIPDATTTTKGIVELATTAETITGTDTTRAVVPEGLTAAIAAALAAYTPSNLPVVTNSTSGKIVIGTVTIQWGTATRPGSTGKQLLVTFGTAFSGSSYYFGATATSPSGATIATASGSSSGGTLNFVDDGNSQGCTWIAIGPT